MKTLLTFFFFLFSSSVAAEIYTCSHELSRFERPGEVETKIFTREGEYFYHNFEWKYEIIRDTNKMLIIVYVLEIDDSEDPGAAMVVMINKKTKEFTERFVNINESKINQTAILNYGQCLISK
ncbi:hypothetical protein OAJ30_01055 [Alphaproteobacteria bacterium]|nr:hypothetical protein [Alphaproteobacteria bacterium]